MKTISKTLNRLKQHLAERISSIAIVLVALLITSQIAVAQGPRIPTPGANGNFADMQVDGDRMKITSRPLYGEMYVKFAWIELDADNHWWKMIRMIDKNGRAYSIEQQNGRYRMRSNGPWEVTDKSSAFFLIDGKNLNDTFKVEFWKAKVLGAHTRVMTEIFRKQDFVGRKVFFNWRDGIEDGYSESYEDAKAPIDESFKIGGSPVTIASSEGGSADHATIRFNTDVAWWTGVKTFELSGKAWLIEKVEGKYNPAHRTIRLPISSLPTEVKLEFWTAKALGVHTHVATKKMIRERFDGRVVTINWGPPPATAINETVKIDGKNATIVSSTGKTGYVTIKFKTGLAWWTAIKFFDRAGKAKLITKANGKYSPANGTLIVPIGSLPGNTKFEFWTAKAFGVHTHMTSRSFATERLNGRTITINWPK